MRNLQVRTVTLYRHEESATTTSVYVCTEIPLADYGGFDELTREGIEKSAEQARQQ